MNIPLSDEQIENIVRRSYQYVAMYNTNNNFAMQYDNPALTGGWNKMSIPTGLADHTLRSIPRPNNDTLYLISMLDMRDDAVVIEFPRFDSKYVSLEVAAYDHYIDIPLSTTKGDFEERTTLLFYTERTKHYKGKRNIKGIDNTLKMTGDFAIAFLRVTPHANDTCRMNYNLCSMQTQKLSTLSEFEGREKKPVTPVEFPDFSNDQHVFRNNFLEVMQFVFNHTSFDPGTYEMDKEVLAVLKPLGVVPGREFDPGKVAKIDGDRFSDIALKVYKNSLGIWGNPEGNPYLEKCFQPKDEMTIEPMTVQSAIGPIGLPYDQAQYPGVGTEDGKPMNAQNHYIIRMTKDDLPPAKAFWSITLYDSANGFFIPNDNYKYSVGENGGIQLDANGGVAIHIAPQQPEDVPADNWLPSGGKNETLDAVMRVYAPDVDKMKDWIPPKAILQP